jgi:hypothetical protein
VARATSPKLDADPVSVVLPKVLRRRLESEAKRRGLKLSPAIRVLLGERMRQLQQDEELDKALAWQRAQAWAAWERFEAGADAEVTWDELEAEFTRKRRR